MLMNCWLWLNYVYYVYARTSIYTQTGVCFHEYTYGAVGLHYSHRTCRTHIIAL